MRRKSHEIARNRVREELMRRGFIVTENRAFLEAEKNGEKIAIKVCGYQKPSGVWLAEGQLEDVDIVIVHFIQSDSTWVFTNYEALGLLGQYKDLYMEKHGRYPKAEGFNLSQLPEPNGWSYFDHYSCNSDILDAVLVDENELRIEKENQAQHGIQNRKDISATEKERLIKSRCGQGLFRARVQEIERECRVTGVREPQFLVASHIKPWIDSDDQEKLDGNNGLLLSPHVDLLFDRGWISFSDDGYI